MRAGCAYCSRAWYVVRQRASYVSVRRASRVDLRRAFLLGVRRDHLVVGLPQRNRQLVGARQLLEVTQREVLQEERRRSVEQWTSQPLGAADDVNEPTLVQRFQ